MIRFNNKTSQITQIQQTVSQRLDRPGDRPRPDQRRISELLSKQDFSDDLLTVASIPRRDLPAYLFAFMELQKEKANQTDRDPVKTSSQSHYDARLNQLEELLLKRSSSSFVLQVWTVYQQNIDQLYLNKLLKKMAKNVAPGNKNRPFINWIRTSTNGNASTYDLIKELADLTLSQAIHLEQLSQALKDLQQPEIFFPRLKNYIDGISSGCNQPGNSQCLTPILIYLDILPDSAFLLSFLLEYFQQASDEQIDVNAELWQYTARNLPEDKQHQIIQAFYSKFRLEDHWNVLNQTIAKILENQAVLDRLDNRAQQYFHQWQIVDKINQHIEEQPRKALFYKNYQLQIRQAYDFTDQILITSFGEFVLADHKDESETVWLLDKVLLDMLVEGGHTNIRQFEDNRETPTARELIMNKAISNLVRLPLDDVNILYAHDFIRQQTQKIRPR